MKSTQLIDDIINIAAEIEDAHGRGCLADVLIAFDKLGKLLHDTKCSFARLANDPNHATAVATGLREYRQKSTLLAGESAQGEQLN